MITNRVFFKIIHFHDTSIQRLSKIQFYDIIIAIIFKAIFEHLLGPLTSEDEDEIEHLESMLSYAPFTEIEKEWVYKAK